MTSGTLALAFAAGVVSVLSPCVLPLLPIVLGTAAADHRFGPAALAAGLCVSYVAIGLFVAAIGFSIGLDADWFRFAASVLIMAMGVLLILPGLQTKLAFASGPVAQWADRHLNALRGSGLPGQFLIGALLGAIWSPCVGPTLGAASLLAAQSRDLPQVAGVMVFFGIGAALPLLILGMLTREALIRWRHRLASASLGVRGALGFVLVAVGVLVLTGLDKSMETALVEASPQWLTDFTTRF
jgi:cytochrome c biogenesis protein CcdA